MMTLSSMRRHYVAIVSILFLVMLIALVLTAGMIGCGQAEPELKCTPMVAAGGSYTVGLKSDGTVVAAGYNGDGQCDVGGRELN